MVFFDSGSQTSYITKELVEQLQPPKLSEEMLRIHTFANQNPKTIRSLLVSVQLKRQDDKWEPIQLNTINEISSKMESYQFTGKHDQIEPVTGTPSILIGIREFWNFVTGLRQIGPKLYKIQTIFGDVLGGESCFERSNYSSTFMSINGKKFDHSNVMENFWALETIGIKENPEEKDDDTAMRLFKQSIRQKPNGTYTVRLPWREPRPVINSNWAMAYSRLQANIRRLSSSPELLQKYDKNLRDQESKGIIEETGRDEQEFFMPHHAVINPKKLRIVLDASAHPKGASSLNQALYRGPVLLPTLVGMLIRWRSCLIPILSDVQAAFHTIEMLPEDRQFCKILWLRDVTKPISSNNLVIKRYTKMVFGVISSPFVLAAVLLHHYDKFDSELAKEMAKNTYVDNILFQCQNEEEALAKIKEAKEIFKQAAMNLREFLSHRPTIMEQIPEEDRLDKAKAQVLGIKWEISDDSLTLKFPKEDESVISRRSVLSALASVYDPLGLINPCLLSTKLFFQRLWEGDRTWDQPVNLEEQKEWQNIRQTWKDQTISIPRLIILNEFEECQIHVFSDASESAYATCVYLRTSKDLCVNSSLIFARNRLRPKNAKSSLTVPRMELLGALIALGFNQQTPNLSLNSADLQKFVKEQTEYFILLEQTKIRPTSPLVGQRLLNSKIRLFGGTALTGSHAQKTNGLTNYHLASKVKIMRVI
ncbi:unnamed protein product [Meloidogyne enterolobii]|uniref:Uncharacterized protein n=1 Tax=Meloidogyne enterolobii TaxID=390850 RepID=A0ACB0YZV9_MELEN